MNLENGKSRSLFCVCHVALSDKNRIIGFYNYKKDPYIWIRNERDHYDYITVYYDDRLVLKKFLVSWEGWTSYF